VHGKIGLVKKNTLQASKFNMRYLIVFGVVNQFLKKDFVNNAILEAITILFLFSTKIGLCQATQQVNKIMEFPVTKDHVHFQMYCYSQESGPSGILVLPENALIWSEDSAKWEYTDGYGLKIFIPIIRTPILDTVIHYNYETYEKAAVISLSYQFQVHGNCIAYFNNGNLFFKGNYNNNNKTGTWKYYHADGRTAITQIWDNGILVSDSSSRYGDILLASNTDTVVYNFNKVIFKDSIIKNDYLFLDNQYLIHPSGKDTWDIKKKSDSGNYELVYESKPKSRVDSTFILSDLCYSEYVSVFYRISFVPSGNFTMFYSNGIPKVKGAFLNGKKQNTWRYYSPNGKCYLILKYENDLLISSKEKD
jgi:antitoxin component YwqK of YwqJK toxin-antitoxin module